MLLRELQLSFLQVFYHLKSKIRIECVPRGKKIIIRLEKNTKFYMILI